jgi:hypothetical protein
MRALAPAALLVLGWASSACSGATSDEPAPDQPKIAWTRPLGTERDDFGRGVAADADGLYVTGYTEGAFDGGDNAGSWDAFLARLDAQGGLAWAREWGGAGEELAQSVVSDGAGAIYVAGYTASELDADGVAGAHDAFLTRFDADGELLWTRQWGTRDDEYVSAAALGPDGIVVVGYTKGAFEGFENQGRDDLFVTLRDETGAAVWTKQLGTSATDYGQAVHVDADGRVLVVGYTAGKLGEDPDPGAEDPFLLALDRDGEQLFLRQWGSETTDYGLGVASDAAGNVYVTGYAYAGVAGEPAIAGEDGYLSKFDAQGALEWTRQFGTLSRDSARFVNVEGSGAIWVGGDTEGAFAKENSAGARDAFIARFNDAGDETFRSQWGGSASEFALGAGVSGQTLYLIGYVEPLDSVRDAQLTRWVF